MQRLTGFAIAFALAACGGGSKSTTPTNSGATTSGPVYAALFEQGRTWTLTMTHNTTPPPDMGPPSSRSAGTATCTVTMAHAMGDAKMAQISCDAAEETLYAPNGTWVANARGLWHFDDELSMDDVHAKMATLDDKQMLIAATAAVRHNEIGDLENGDGLEVFGAKAGVDGAWCVYYTMAMGDEAGFEVCLAAGRGIVSGTSFSAGATVLELTYTAK
jgi:hypothetical protein